MRQFRLTVMQTALTVALALGAGAAVQGTALAEPAAALALPEATLQVGATSVPYRDSGGNGVAVIFLHAASGSSQMWLHQFPAFTAAGFRVIAIDWRQRNPGSPIGSHSTMLIDAVLAKLGVQRAHVLGTAAGGGAAFQFALAHPDKVRSLVVANSIGFVTDRAYVEMGERMRPAPQFAALPIDFIELGPSYRAANPDGVARWKALAHSSIPRTPVATGTPATLAPGSNVPVTFAQLESLTMPTLLLGGDADLYAPPSVLRMIGAHIRHADLVIIPESGHSAYWEQPDLFNRTTLEFFRKH